MSLDYVSLRLAPAPDYFLDLDLLTNNRFPHLDQFLTRAKVLSLYRQFIRATKGFGDNAARWETVRWVRTDFERYKDVTDQVSCSRSRPAHRLKVESTVWRISLFSLSCGKSSLE